MHFCGFPVEADGGLFEDLLSGYGTLIPFTRMPSQCGFSVRRSRRDVIFVAPYQGCHVAEQVIPNESMTLTKRTSIWLNFR